MMEAILNGVTYTAANFASPPSAHFANDPIGDELQADTLTVELMGEMGNVLIKTADGDIFKTSDGALVRVGRTSGKPEADYGDVITLYNGDGLLIAKMYVESIERISRETYRISAISALGLLIKRTHYGGIYNGVLASTLIADIMGTVPYTIGGAIGNELVYGHLPIASARDNLHVLLQALGASILKDDNGDILINYLNEVSVAALTDGEIYLGEGDVQTPAHATDVIVVEHSFLQTTYDEEVTLFDNTNGATVTAKLVAFDAPCYGLSVTGSLTIDSSDANYAIVTGVGTLVGSKYTHTQQEYAVSTGATGEQMTVAVRDNELVNTTNSYNLAMRLAGYYGKANQATIAAAVSKIWTGHYITFKNVYGEASDGYVTEAEVALSVGVDKSNLTIATDYEVGPFGANYDSVLVLDTSGTWTVPADMTGQHVRVICIGGAMGGQAGYNGGDGQQLTSSNAAGTGGAGGSGGIGFNIVIDELDLTAASYAVTIGTGGAGGGSDGALGTLGGATTFGSIDSDDGVQATGYYDIINAVTYGGAGTDGIAGGNGGARLGRAGENVTYNGITYTGGTGGANQTSPGGSEFSGGGGGAAAGANGENAGPPEIATGVYSKAGGGANATIVPTQQTLGVGGDGGHGGGGGGAGGGFKDSKGYYPYPDTWIAPGGTGSAGGQGSDGLVLIYYNA